MKVLTTRSNFESKMKSLVCVLILLLLVLECESKSKMSYRAKLELARQHYKRVVHEISCGLPKPRIFRVQNASMRVVPSATILHRCGENSGCCSKAAHKCVAKTKEKVKLYFLISSPPGPSTRKRKRNKIKKFMFYNHTECHCMDMSYNPR